MVKIITDTSALYTIEEGKQMEVTVLPLSIMIDGQEQRDLCMDVSAFLEKIRTGHVPTSSQPPIGEVVEAYEAYQGEEIINLCMADGLSGTYQTACSAREQVDNKEQVHVLNTKTLCGPHRYLVEKAVKLRDEGYQVQDILSRLQESMNHMHSFLIPQDFNFLKRGGRLKGSAATIGGLLKLKPIMEAVDEGTRLDKFTIARTLSKAVDLVADHFEKQQIGEGYKIFVSHADAKAGADMILKRMKERFSKCSFELLELSPAFITQGGPECIAIQFIKM